MASGSWLDELPVVADRAFRIFDSVEVAFYGRLPALVAARATGFDSLAGDIRLACENATLAKHGREFFQAAVERKPGPRDNSDLELDDLPADASLRTALIALADELRALSDEWLREVVSPCQTMYSDAVGAAMTTDELTAADLGNLRWAVEASHSLWVEMIDHMVQLRDFANVAASL